MLHQHQHPNSRTIHRERPRRQRALPRPHREPRHRRNHRPLKPHRQHTRQHNLNRPRLSHRVGNSLSTSLGLRIGSSLHHRRRLRRRVPHTRPPRTLARNPAGQRHHPIHEQLALDRRRLIQIRRLHRPRVRHQHRQEPRTLLRTTTQHPIPRHLTATSLSLGRVPTQQHPTLNRNRRQTPRSAQPPSSSRRRTRRHHHRRQHRHRNTHTTHHQPPPHPKQRQPNTSAHPAANSPKRPHSTRAARQANITIRRVKHPHSRLLS